MAVLIYIFNGLSAHAEDKKSFKMLVEEYQQAGNDEGRRSEVRKQLDRADIKTPEDMAELRKILSKKELDKNLSILAVGKINKIQDISFDDDLIEILKEEKPIAEKITRNEAADMGEMERQIHMTTAWFIIEKLGYHKNQKAVPLIKEFLNIPDLQYYASEALARIGDKSASEDIKEKAYKGEVINYGGLGLDEAIQIVTDLEDKSKKDKWKKITNQLINIRDPQAKPYLKKLFNHEDEDVRGQAAIAFTNMVSNNDVDVLVEITNHRDYKVRSRAVYGMMRLKDVPFDDILINVLRYDPDNLPRAKAARALGYKMVSKSVPYLEKALNDEDYYVRRESFISLYVLTGKKYDFNGRNQSTDRAAEEQSKYPSIY